MRIDRRRKGQETAGRRLREEEGGELACGSASSAKERGRERVQQSLSARVRNWVWNVFLRKEESGVVLGCWASPVGLSPDSYFFSSWMFFFFQFYFLFWNSNNKSNIQFNSKLLQILPWVLVLFNLNILSLKIK